MHATRIAAAPAVVGHAHRADALSGHHLLSNPNIGSCSHVTIFGHNAVAVVDANTIAVARAPTSFDHGACPCCGDHSPLGVSHVDTVMQNSPAPAEARRE